MDIYVILVCFLVFALGSSIGSFLNVCIYRIPAGRSVVSPPSACDDCGSHLKWYDMIPVLSALWLRGRCRVCGARFSLRHAFVELLTGAIFVYVVILGLTFNSAAVFDLYGITEFTPNMAVSVLLMLVMSSVLIISTFTDIDHRIIPNKVIVFGVFVGLASLAFAAPSGALDRLVSSIVLFAVFFAVSALTRAFGAGDAKLFALLGLFHGRSAMYPVLGTFILAGIYAIALVALRRASSRTRVPLAPFIALSYFALLWSIA